MANLDRLTRIADMVDREIDRGEYSFELRGWGCGTTACVIGLAVHLGEFKAEGLKSEGLFSELAGSKITSRYIINNDPGFDYVPKYDKHLGWPAVMALFDIDANTAEHFFSYYRYPALSGINAARAVSKRLRDYVAAHTPAPVAVIVEKARELETV